MPACACSLRQLRIKVVHQAAEDTHNMSKRDWILGSRWDAIDNTLELMYLTGAATEITTLLSGKEFMSIFRRRLYSPLGTPGVRSFCLTE